MGRVVERSVAARVARRELAVGDHRWLPRVGAGTGDGLSTGAAPALLGAQDAQYLGAGTAPRRKTGQGAGAEDLLGRACRCGAAGLRFRFHWRSRYPAMIRQLERDLSELLHFFVFPRHLWRKLRTTNVIERCFVEVRRRTRPMVVFTNVESVDRIIYAIFSRFNEDWKNHTLELFTQAA